MRKVVAQGGGVDVASGMVGTNGAQGAAAPTNQAPCPSSPINLQELNSAYDSLMASLNTLGVSDPVRCLNDLATSLKNKQNSGKYMSQQERTMLQKIQALHHEEKEIANQFSGLPNRQNTESLSDLATGLYTHERSLRQLAVEWEKMERLLQYLLNPS